MDVGTASWESARTMHRLTVWEDMLENARSTTHSRQRRSVSCRAEKHGRGKGMEMENSRVSANWEGERRVLESLIEKRESWI